MWCSCLLSICSQSLYSIEVFSNWINFFDRKNVSKLEQKANKKCNISKCWNELRTYSVGSDEINWEAAGFNWKLPTSNLQIETCKTESHKTNSYKLENHKLLQIDSYKLKSLQIENSINILRLIRDLKSIKMEVNKLTSAVITQQLSQYIA